MAYPASAYPPDNLLGTTGGSVTGFTPSPMLTVPIGTGLPKFSQPVAKPPVVPKVTAPLASAKRISVGPPKPATGGGTQTGSGVTAQNNLTPIVQAAAAPNPHGVFAQNVTDMLMQAQQKGFGSQLGMNQAEQGLITNQNAALTAPVQDPNAAPLPYTPAQVMGVAGARSGMFSPALDALKAAQQSRDQRMTTYASSLKQMADIEAQTQANELAQQKNELQGRTPVPAGQVTDKAGHVLDRFYIPATGQFVTAPHNPDDLFNTGSPTSSTPSGQQPTTGMGAPHGSALAENNVVGMRGPNGSFVSYTTPEVSFAAAVKDIHNKQIGNTSTGLNANSTLEDFVNTWINGPGQGRQPGQGYTADHVAADLGVTTQTPIGQLDATQLATSVAKHETGWVPGQSGQGNTPAPTTSQGATNVQQPLPPEVSNELGTPAQKSNFGYLWIDSSRISPALQDTAPTLTQPYNVPVLSTTDANTIRQTDLAAANIDLLKQMFLKYAPPDATGRIGAIPTQALQTYLQSVPELAIHTPITDAIRITVSSAGGSIQGERIGTQILTAIGGDLPDPTDTYDTFMKKITAYNQLFDNKQRSIILPNQTPNSGGGTTPPPSSGQPKTLTGPNGTLTLGTDGLYH